MGKGILTVEDSRSQSDKTYSVGLLAHHQEHLNCIYSLWYYTRDSLPAGFMGELELTPTCLSDVFARHQEHLNCIYSLWYYTRESLPAGFMVGLELTSTRFRSSSGVSKLYL